MARHLRKLLCIVLVVFLLVGCTPTSTSNPEDSMAKLEQRIASYAQLGTAPDDNYRTWYEVFVYSFCDSNADGIGDLQGLISKLDYLEELGVNGIWMMPISPSYSYHKYDVNDYYAIDPQYGTMSDFEQLMAECQRRDIKVILDLVVNHCGSGNPWFQEATDYLRNLDPGQVPTAEECKYYDYFTFATEMKSGYHRVSGTPYYYEGQFSSSMPDLNWANQDMRADVKDVMQFWLDKGVSGFRVDAAKEFYTGAVGKNVEVMNWLQTTASSIKPDVYMVAEVWEVDYRTLAEYYESGFTSIFNYQYGNYDGMLCKILNGRGNPGMVTRWAKALKTVDEAFSKSNPNYIDAPFLSNHDVGRIYGFVNGDPMRIKMAGAMNLFMSGAAFIYYGEEIGMPGSGNDPSKRAPMYWNADRDNGTTMLPPGCTLPDTGYTLGSYEEQKDDAGSIYNYYREAIAIRNGLPVIARGKTVPEDTLNVACVTAVRKTWNDQQCIIIMNIDDDEAGATVDLSSYTDWKLAASLSVSEQTVSQEGSSLKLPAYGIAILVPNN